MIVTWLPNTWAQTMVSASHCVGLTLPGMIEDPGSFSGSISSPRPERGPDARKRMSLAILFSDTATAFSAPDASTMASLPASASNLLAAGTKEQPVSFATSAAKASAKPACAFSPVPTAVPPCASCSSRGSGAFDARDAVADLLSVAGKVLAEGQRRRILGMRATDLDDVGERGRLLRQRRLQQPQRRQQPARRFR